MNPTLHLAVAVVTCALVAYSLAVITEQRHKKLTPFTLRFLAAGVLLDATATILMIVGSRRIPLTLHGVLGYCAFAAMATDTVLLFRHRKKHGIGSPLPRLLHRYTRGAWLFFGSLLILPAECLP